MVPSEEALCWITKGPPVPQKALDLGKDLLPGSHRTGPVEVAKRVR